MRNSRSRSRSSRTGRNREIVVPAAPGGVSPEHALGPLSDLERLNAPTYRILLIERDAAEANATRAALAETEGRAFSVEWVRDLSAGVDRLNTGQIDAVLLDLFLSDCQGLATFEQLRQGAPQVPTFIICDLGDESIAMEAVERGAQ